MDLRDRFTEMREMDLQVQSKWRLSPAPRSPGTPSGVAWRLLRATFPGLLEEAAGTPFPSHEGHSKHSVCVQHGDDDTAAQWKLACFSEGLHLSLRAELGVLHSDVKVHCLPEFLKRKDLESRVLCGDLGTLVDLEGRTLTSCTL